MVSYQVEESPGRFLLDNGYLISKDDNEKIEVDAKIKLFNFSSHSDKNQLMNFVNNLNFKPDAKIFCLHGEEDSCLAFSNRINEELPIEAFAPKNEEIYD